jgi:hypothetical protein
MKCDLGVVAAAALLVCTMAVGSDALAAGHGGGGAGFGGGHMGGGFRGPLLESVPSNPPPPRATAITSLIASLKSKRPFRVGAFLM